jgi:hypothetical protein
MYWYILLRLVLWGLGLALGLLPTIWFSHGNISINPITTLQAINQSGLFREIFFVALPASMLALTTVSEFLIIHEDGETTFFGWLAIFANLSGVAYGLFGIMTFGPESGPLTQTALEAFSSTVVVALLTSLATEIGVAIGTGWQRFRSS